MTQFEIRSMQNIAYYQKKEKNSVHKGKPHTTQGIPGENRRYKNLPVPDARCGPSGRNPKAVIITDGRQGINYNLNIISTRSKNWKK